MMLNVRSSRPVFWMFLLLLLLMPLPMASNRLWLLAVVGSWVCLLIVWRLWQRPLFDQYQPWRDVNNQSHWQRARFFFMMMGCWLVWLMLQNIPGVGNFLAEPDEAFIYPQVSDQFFVASIDWFSTRWFLMKAMIYAGCIWLMFSLIRSQRRLEMMLMVLIASAVLQAVLAVLLLAMGAHYQLFFEEVFHINRGKGTFMYHNHFAGYMELVLCLGIGLMISKLREGSADNWKQRIRSWVQLLLSRKALLRIALIVIVIGLIVSRSRMGNAAFFISLLLVGLIAILLSKKATRSTVLFISSLIVLDIVIIGGVVGVEKVMQRLEATNLQQLQPEERAQAGYLEESVEQRTSPGVSALNIVKDYPVAGTGGGTFHLAFQPYQSRELQGYYDYAHNDYFQVLSEVGVAGFLILLVMVVHSMVYSIRILLRRSDAFARGMAVGSLMGVVALLIHATVDFNFYNTTNALLFLMVMVIPYFVGCYGRYSAKAVKRKI